MATKKVTIPIPNPTPESDPAEQLTAWVKSEKQAHPAALYVFVGPGLGVPGLPHQLTLAQAEAGQMTATLKAALENRNYTRAAVTASPTNQKVEGN